MELKATTSPLLSALLAIRQESIQWNWKASLRRRRVDLSPNSARIHSMELKGFLPHSCPTLDFSLRIHSMELKGGMVWDN